jgi:enolase-phosphatase E1
VVKAILIDIEGTTSSISFVHEVLFPFAKRELPTFIRENEEQPNVWEQLNAVRAQDPAADDVDSIIATLMGWIEEDKKATPLKALQGMIWEAGYQSGELKGHLYKDAHQMMIRWKSQGIPLYIFSSGSIYAQKLLFGHSCFGDLNPLFSGNFDTTTGSKKEATSYLAIAGRMDFNATEILFLSDVGAELDAAKEAGMKTVQLVRDDSIVPAEGHKQVKSFDEIQL